MSIPRRDEDPQWLGSVATGHKEGCKGFAALMAVTLVQRIFGGEYGVIFSNLRNTRRQLFLACF